jgi:cytochrome d ubiquinol oxidase subunit II
MITYSFLQHYWWFLIALLGGLLSFLLFVQGGQSMIFSLSKTEDEKRLLVNVLGRKWEYTFTTLVTFGGAIFASFPLLYSTSFGGAYWVWMIILFCFTLQAVSYEFQTKAGNLLGKNIYRFFLFLNGLLGTFLLGVVIATFFTGSDFVVDKGNISNPFSPIISRWQNPWHGLEALLNLRNICFGLAVFFLSRALAVLYFINRMDHPILEKRSRKYLWYNAIPFVIFFLTFVVWTFLSDGFAANSVSGEVYMSPHKYFLNLVEMPVVMIIFLLGVCGVLFGIIRTLLSEKFRKGIWFAGTGTVLTVLSLLLLAGFNNTALYPSATHLQSSLTLYNASSSEYTLKVMSIVSLIIPFVVLYIFYAWRALEKKRTNVQEINEEPHAY